MAENPHGAPIYGHLGIPTYRERTWQWSAPNHQNLYLIPIDSGQLLQGPSANAYARENNAIKKLDNSSLKRLSRNFPPLASTLSFIRPWVNENVQRQHVDDSSGSSPDTPLAVGLLPRESGNGAPVPVVILPDPTFLDTIRFRIGAARRQGWDDQVTGLSHWIERPDFSRQSEVAGRTGDALYQQLCLSIPGNANKPSRYLAVRSTSTISIFAPIVRDKALSNEYHTSGASDQTVDPNYIESLPTSERPYADMAFDPGNETQFVTIDEGGHWRIWNVIIRPPSVKQNVRAPSLRRTKLLHRGSIAHDANGSGFAAVHDGWHRVVWVDVNQFIACNRRRVWLIQLLSVHTTAGPQLRTEDEGILDMHKVPGKTNLFLLITTLDVYCLAIDTREDGSLSLVVAMNWQHGRDANDHTLHCALQILQQPKLQSSLQNYRSENFAETNFLLVLFSKSTSIVTQYCCCLAGNKELQVTRPRLLNLSASDILRSKKDDEFEAGDQIQDLFIRPLKSIQRNSISLASQSDAGKSSDTYFYQVLVYSQHRAFGDILCYVTRVPDTKLDVDESDWTGPILTKQLVNGTNDDDLQEMDDFIVSDDSSAGDAKPSEEAASVSQLPNTSSVAVRYPKVYEQMCTFDLGEPLDLISALNDVKSAWDDHTDSTSQQLQILSQLMPVNAVIGDVDEASDVLDAFVALKSLSNAHTGALMLIKLVGDANNIMCAELGNERESISQLFRQVIQTWIYPLSRKTPGKVRLLRQRLAKSISVAVWLSSIALVPESSIDRGIFDTLDSPVESADGISAVHRLQKYTTLRTNGPTLNRSLDKVLSHWALGDDPHAYDFEATQEKLSGVSRELRHLSPGAQARLQRRVQRDAERQQRRLGGATSQPTSTPTLSFDERSTEATQATQWSQQSQDRVQSAVGHRVKGHISLTQPNPAGMEKTTSSQAYGASQSQPPAVASQIEEGRHARRMDSRKPKIKLAGRRAGF